MFDRQLAKWRLEKEGYLASIDVHLGELGTVDVFGVKIGKEKTGRAVFGIVRGWWHSGAYLTPSLLRNHLQTERHLLDRAFAEDRLGRAAQLFQLNNLPDKVLFFSKRSPSLADDAERDLSAAGIRVIYLEDVLAEALAEASADDLGQGTIFQVLAMVKGANIFKEMARLAREARRAEKSAEATAGHKVIKASLQLDLLAHLIAQEDSGEDAS